MAVISGNQIEELVQMFATRGVQFHHACQLVDFAAYLKVGGIPSRGRMETDKLPYTSFDTDHRDRENQVWDLVFGNLQDFGVNFAQFRRNENTAPTPNPYGPILLVFNPDVLKESTDVAICLRSAGGRSFDRFSEALSSCEEVNRIFQFEDVSQAPNQYAKSYIAYAQELRERFNNQDAQTPEVSCTTPDGILSFHHLDKIIVDPYCVEGKNLLPVVEAMKREYGLPGVVWRRLYKDGESRLEIKQELANHLLEKQLRLSDLLNDDEYSDALKDWARRLRNGNMGFFFDRFANYLRAGTILPLREM